MSYTIHQDILDDVAAQEYQDYLQVSGVLMVCKNPACKRPESEMVQPRVGAMENAMCGFCAKPMEVAKS